MVGAICLLGQVSSPVFLNLLLPLSIAPLAFLLLLPFLLHSFLFKSEPGIQSFLPFFLLPKLFLFLQPQAQKV